MKHSPQELRENDKSTKLEEVGTWAQNHKYVLIKAKGSEPCVTAPWCKKKEKE